MNPFILSRATKIVMDVPLKPISSAAAILRRDIRETLTSEAEPNVIRVLLDESLGEERYRAEVSPKAVTLTCGDGLGAVYALLSISERCLGIGPLDWWMGLNPARRETVSLPCGVWQLPPFAVRRRGWFVNDEVLLTGWHAEESAREATWRRVFETILRCGGNMVIPGTDRQFDGEALNQMALDMGLWLTQHHAELLGARMFARVYPDLQPSYARYPERFEALWREAARRWAGAKVVWAVGFRGQGDMAFWHNDPAFDTDEKRGAFISRVIRRQMAIVREYDPEALFCTNLYGEMMGLYRDGWLEIPGEVIRVWADNGFGRMVSRRQDSLNPRTDAMPGADEPGRNGIYYHVSFYDLQAANHITMLQVPPEDVAGELGTVLSHGAKDYWLLNVGSVRPHAFFIDLVSRLWREGECDVRSAAEAFAERYYADEKAASLLTGYGEASIAYGPNADDKAGDQFYHFTLRALAQALASGRTSQPLKSLRWLSDASDYEGQVRQALDIARPGIRNWLEYLNACDAMRVGLAPEPARRLEDTLICMGTIHQCGCGSLYDFCQAILHALRENWLQAYLWTGRALEGNRRAEAAMEAACHGRFAHYYDNDCFVGVRLTGRVLEGVRAWLRLRGDGPLFYGWEMEYLIPKEQRPLLQTHRTAQLSDDELCRRLEGEVLMEEISLPDSGN